MCTDISKVTLHKKSREHLQALCLHQGGGDDYKLAASVGPRISARLKP